MVFTAPVLLYTACDDTTGPDGELFQLEVAAQTVSCQGEAVQQCYLVRQSSSEDWGNFYAPIEGFDYEPGYEYKILVLRVRLADPPMDGADSVYRLIRILSKEPVIYAA
jgi:hypothetical protein